MIHLVNDDPSVREALTLLLATYGREVTSDPDAAHLLATIKKAQPGILILDLRMPAKSGLQLMNKLADLRIGWPKIMITGHGDIEACRRAFKAGVSDFLTKPVDEHVLMEAITACEAMLGEFLPDCRRINYESWSETVCRVGRKRRSARAVALGYCSR